MDDYTEDGCMIDTGTEDEYDVVKAEPAEDGVDAVVKRELQNVDAEDVKLFASREVQRNHWYRTTMAAFALPEAYRIPEDIKPVAMHRVDVITKVLGGNVQAAFVRGRDGRDMLFATPAQSPFLPRAPGQSGLFFTFSWRAAAGATSVVRLFVRDPQEAIWLYMGEYKNKAMRQMTREEWNLQSEPVKALRVSSVLKREYAAARAMRRRMARRNKIKREPGKPARHKKVKTERTKSVRKTSPKEAANQALRAALDDGLENMEVIALECVGYDASIQERLSDYARARMPSETPSRSAKRKQPAGSSDEDKSKERSSKRARSESSTSVSEPTRRQPQRSARKGVVYGE